MATDMKRVLMACRKGWALLCVVPSVCWGQELIDPTMPPAELSARQGGGEFGGLQSIIISPSRRAAIINGQTVELGGKVGDVRLIEVSESGVVLQGAKGRQALTLFPNVKINRKAVLPPMKDDVKSPARMDKSAGKSADRAGKKEEK